MIKEPWTHQSKAQGPWENFVNTLLIGRDFFPPLPGRAVLVVPSPEIPDIIGESEFIHLFNQMFLYQAPLGQQLWAKYSAQPLDYRNE